jgi:hypothetical protein
LGFLHYISFILAIPLALAVQIGLFGLAWLIGFGNKRIRALMRYVRSKMKRLKKQPM